MSIYAAFEQSKDYILIEAFPLRGDLWRVKLDTKKRGHVWSNNPKTNEDRFARIGLSVRQYGTGLDGYYAVVEIKNTARNDGA